MSIDYERLAKRVIELSGGKDKLNSEMDENLSKINEKWDQNIEAIGRILRIHLFVEHFLTKCLEAFNPKLGSIKKARLTFSQKLTLIENYSEETKELSKGIKRLNEIRNRLAHNLDSTVSDHDKELLLSVSYFKVLREELAKPGIASDDNLVVLEDFAKHVGVRLESLANPDSLSKRFEQAFREITNKSS